MTQPALFTAPHPAAGLLPPPWRRVLEVTVPGPPVGAARPRVVRLPNGASRAYMPDASVKQEMRLVHVASEAWGDRAPLDELVRVDVRAVVERPAKLVPRRHGGTLSGPGEERIIACGYTALDRLPCPTKPDADNVAKLAMDALVKAGVMVDDTRVVELAVSKVYAAMASGPCTEVAVYVLSGTAGRWW